jgi:hypothetical protein
MSNKNTHQANSRMFKKLLKRPIAFHAHFVDVTGDILASLMLSQAQYWSERVEEEKDGWFYKSQQEWTEETRLHRFQQEKARKLLRGLGILEEKKQGVPCRLFFRINYEKLEQLYLRQCDTAVRAFHEMRVAVNVGHNSQYAKVPAN